MDKQTFEGSTRRNLRGEEGATRCWALARKLVLGLTLALACQTAPAQVMYRIKPIGYLDGCTSSFPIPYGFNEADQVTGYACNAHGDTHAFLWKNTGTPMVDLGPPGGGSYSEGVALSASGLVTGDAQDSTGEFGFVSSGNGTPMTRIKDSLGGNAIYPASINDLGQLTGVAYPAGKSVWHAFVWKNDGTPLHDLGTLGGDNSYGEALNAYAQIAGFAQLPGNTAYHAFVWKNDGTPMHDLGTLGGASSEAYFINASGQVAGSSDAPGFKNPKEHAFLWRNDGTPMQDLGTLGGLDSYPVALNDSGQVAGSSYTVGVEEQGKHAFVWLNDGTPMQDLGTLSGTRSEGFGINSSGQVTGRAIVGRWSTWHAFLWRNDGTKMQDLNTLIDPTDPLKTHVILFSGDFINGVGDILAEGTDLRTGQTGLYLLQGTVLTLSPRALAFGNQPINTKSTTKSVTMTNTSAKVVAIASIVLKSSAAGQFASTNNCSSTLAGHAICTIKVTFKPTTKGAKSATLNVNGGGGGLRTVALTGTGT